MQLPCGIAEGTEECRSFDFAQDDGLRPYELRIAKLVYEFAVRKRFAVVVA
jgi:hypothetical protein